MLREQRGLAGLMREFGLTLSAAVVLSVTLSLTFTPMMCGKALKRLRAAEEPAHEGAGGRLRQAGAGLCPLAGRGDAAQAADATSSSAPPSRRWCSTPPPTPASSRSRTPASSRPVVTLPQDSAHPKTDAKAREVAHIIAADSDVLEAAARQRQGNLSGVGITFAQVTRTIGRKSTIPRWRQRLRPQKPARVVGAPRCR